MPVSKLQHECKEKQAYEDDTGAVWEYLSFFKTRAVLLHSDNILSWHRHNKSAPNDAEVQSVAYLP